jgi:hypothetical protein
LTWAFLNQQSWSLNRFGPANKFWAWSFRRVSI